VPLGERRQAAPFGRPHAFGPDRLAEDTLDHERMDVNETVLQQMEAQHGRLLIFQAVGGDLAAAAVEDEVVGRILVLDHVQPLVDFPAEFHAVQVTTDECRTQRLPKLHQRPIRGVLQVGAGEAAQDVGGRRGAEPERGGVADHLVVLLGDQRPIDRAREHGLQGGVANPRIHATTHRVVREHFAEERPSLQPLPAGPFQAVLRLERRITRDGMVSVDGNLYSVPDTTRRRPVEVHSTAGEVRILEDGRIVAVHPVMDGRGQRRIIAGHRTAPPPVNSQTPRNGPPPGRSGLGGDLQQQLLPL